MGHDFSSQSIIQLKIVAVSRQRDALIDEKEDSLFIRKIAFILLCALCKVRTHRFPNSQTFRICSRFPHEKMISNFTRYFSPHLDTPTLHHSFGTRTTHNGIRKKEHHWKWKKEFKSMSVSTPVVGSEAGNDEKLNLPWIHNRSSTYQSPIKQWNSNQENKSCTNLTFSLLQQIFRRQVRDVDCCC